MDVLPVILLALAAFVVARLVLMARGPRARANPGAAVPAVARDPSRGGGSGR